MQRYRIHVGLAVPTHRARPLLTTILTAGGRLLEESEGRWRVADPEGKLVLVSEA